MTELSKEAGVLRTRLERGSLNLKELVSFLSKVENLSPLSGRKKSKSTSYNERFQRQLDNLNLQRSIKKPD